MEGHHLLRRLIHSMAWVVLIYYVLPEEIAGVQKRSLLFLTVAIVLAFEGLRLYKGWHLYGMRHYEKKQIAAYAWAAMGAGIALLLFPMHLAFVCLLGLGIVDPLVGEIREHAENFYPIVPYVAWAIISLLGLFFLTSFAVWVIVILSLIGSAVAIAAERPQLIVDDDFLMVVAPIFVLRGIELLIL